MAIVPRVNLMNRALLSCLDSLPRIGIDRSPKKPPKTDYECVYNKTRLMALPFAALTGGDSILVRHFQPLNWSNGRTPRRLVRYLVDDDLGNQQGT